MEEPDPNNVPEPDAAPAAPAGPAAGPRRRPAATVAIEVDGRSVEVPDDVTLLEALREHAGLRSVKDGCAPQGQCGCCTVLVDGAPRVACVTPVRRVAGRSIVTVDGLGGDVTATWADAFTATGGSQCGFCTPGIVCRLEGARAKLAGGDPASVPVGAAARPALDRALAAHLCRCTGWQPIVEAWDVAVPLLAGTAETAGPGSVGAEVDRALPGRPAGAGRDAAARRATIEGRAVQIVGPEVALGRGGFADDTAPTGALVALPDGAGGWAVGETLSEARAAAAKVQGRRTTVEGRPPLDLPDGDWAATLRTSWVEPAYLEPDAAWCEPGGEPVGPLTNGGAFGGKVSSPVAAEARELADRAGRPVRVLLAREDVVRVGPKRPPVAGGVRADGTGVLRVVATPGLEAVVAAHARGLTVEAVEVPGPATSVDLRAAGWAEATMLLAAARGRPAPVRSAEGAEAEVEIDPADGSVRVRVDAGDPLDEVVLRSYCIGAVHQALSWVRSEAIAVTEEGRIADLTIRSFGILKAAEMPLVTVEIAPSTAPPVNGSDAVFVAAAAAAWLADGAPPDLPTRR